MHPSFSRPSIRVATLLSVMVVALSMWRCHSRKSIAEITAPKTLEDNVWLAPDTTTIPENEEGQMIRYGRRLIANTSLYLGPQGSVAHITNGMDCQNCHLQAGTKPFGNNYGSVASLYPKFRARSGTIETIAKRVNDCIERSLNGTALDTTSREMQGIVAYIRWLGTNVPKGERAPGSGLHDIAFLDRAADTVKGKKLFAEKCTVCHGTQGQGVTAGSDYMYPPVWGEHSYNQGAGLYRLSMIARFIHSNMPLGARYDSTLLSVDDAWDIAAYICSMPRPTKDFSRDWPKLDTKPFDHPFGPYTDTLTEVQHKYGPFAVQRVNR